MAEDYLDEISETRLSRSIGLLLMLVVGAVPIVFSTAGYAVYLGPQTNVFQAGMLLVASLIAVAAALGDRLTQRLERHRRLVILSAAGVAWSAIVTMTAVKPVVSHEAPFTMFCYAVLFAGFLSYGERRSVLALGAILVPSTINSIVVLFQATRVWSPVPWMAEGKLANIGFLGNPNITGAYLIVPTIAAVASVLVFRKWRLPLVLVALLHLAALFSAQTVSAAIAITAALISMAFLARSAKVILGVGVVLVAGAAAVFSYGPTRARIGELGVALAEGHYVEFSSFRLPADAVAANVFLEHPLVGVGPGGFSARYLTYRLDIDEKYPAWLDPALRGEVSFETVHNDHLQLLSESGLPGYLLAVVLAVSVARLTFSRRAGAKSEQEAFVFWFALPAVVGFAIVTLAQFPLEITAATSSVVYAAALCHVWSRDAAR